MARQTNSLRKYIEYIPNRLVYLKVFGIGCQYNEYKYYKRLYREIKNYLKANREFGLYILQRIDILDYKVFYKASERTCYRILATQRAKFVRFILQKEKELLKIYPFQETDLMGVQNG